MSEPTSTTDVRPDAVPRPVAASERISSIDTLRGVAVLGILVMNIYGFAMPFAAYQNPLAYGGTEWYNLGTWYFTHLFFDQKFMTIFSILYGAGLVMMASRAEARGAPYAAIWYRRSVWLLVIGALHAYLVWMGDILFFYALIGMLIFPFRKRTPAKLIAIACLVLPVSVLLGYAGGAQMQQLQTAGAEISILQEAGEELSPEQQETLEAYEGMADIMKPPEVQVAEDLAAYRGDYAGIVSHRAPTVVMMQTQAMLFFILWRVAGLMLVGMALMKLGILSAAKSDTFYKGMLALGYGLGLPLVALSAYLMRTHDWDMLWIIRVGGIPNYIGSVLVAFGHIALVMLIVRAGLLQKLMQRFAAVGRMAFTNYLMHSIVMTTVFYGYGFGLYGEVPRFWQMAFVALMVGFQLWVSPIWLARFRFGPAEWLWRTLTYWQFQPAQKAVTE